MLTRCKNTYCIKLYFEFDCPDCFSPIFASQRKSRSIFAPPTEKSFPCLRSHVFASAPDPLNTFPRSNFPGDGKVANLLPTCYGHVTGKLVWWILSLTRSFFLWIPTLTLSSYDQVKHVITLFSCPMGKQMFFFMCVALFSSLFHCTLWPPGQFCCPNGHSVVLWMFVSFFPFLLLYYQVKSSSLISEVA